MLKSKSYEEFVWEDKHQHAFDQVKWYLVNPLVLMPPRAGRPLKLYLPATNTTIGCMLAQENGEGKEQAMYYLSQMLNDPKTRYTVIEKLYLSLFYACTKLHHYMLPITVHVICKTDVIKYMLTRPIVRGQIAK